MQTRPVYGTVLYDMVGGMADSTMSLFLKEVQSGSLRKNVYDGLKRSLDIIDQIDAPHDDIDWQAKKYPGFAKSYCLEKFWGALSESTGYGLGEDDLEMLSSGTGNAFYYLMKMNLFFYDQRDPWSSGIRRDITRTMLNLKQMDSGEPCDGPDALK